MGQTGKTAYDVPDYFGSYQKAIGRAYYFLLYGIFYFCPIHLLIAAFNLNYYVLIFYALVMLIQRQVNRSQKYIDFLNNVIQVRKGLKSITLRYEEPVSKDQKCLFGFHPHGVLSASVLTFMNDSAGPLSTMVTLSSRFMLNLPFVGLLLRLWGVEPVNAKNLKRLMKEGSNVALVPGGFQQATLTVPDEFRVYIKERMGFIKYSLQNNYTIHPVLSLHEHKMFWTFRYFVNIRLWLNKFKIPGVIYINPKSFLFPSPDHPFQAVVGRGIRGKCYQDGQVPTKEEIAKVHAEYIEEIKRVYEANKEIIGGPLKIY